MGFKDDAFVPWSATPIEGAPRISIVVNHLAGTKDIVWLKSGCRVGNINFVIDSKFVASTWQRVFHMYHVPAVILSRHRQSAALEQQINAFRSWRPKPERYAVV